MVPGGMRPDLSYLVGSSPGAYVVREDQYPLMLQLTALLAEMGVVRMVFLSQSVALRWLAPRR